MPVLVEFGAAVPVSTVTTIMPWTRLQADRLAFFVKNVDLAVAVTFLLDAGVLDPQTQEIYFDPRATIVIGDGPCPPNTPDSVEIGDLPVRPWWRLSARTQGPSWPTALVKFCVLGGSYSR
jgi:hypothetical protein